ncbi:hypothetical protein, partial [Salmonella sp. s54925]|uniref:hypothetical protein n=1 Tax=Salmonella sp. s54925 TaxID=3159674 RepID=UPI0039808E8F
MIKIAEEKEHAQVQADEHSKEAERLKEELAESNLVKEENLRKLTEAQTLQSMPYVTAAEGDEDSRELEANAEALSQTELDRTTQLSKKSDLGAQLKKLGSELEVSRVES